MAELGIVDIREIIRLIKSLYNYDFTSYALTSFKQRLERVMKLYALGSLDSLMRKIQDDADFFDAFLFELTVSSTEMFRDPSLWRWLREDFFPEQIDKNVGKYKIWLPLCVSGGELYSLAILLHEMDMADKVQITASCISNKSIALIRGGSYDAKKVEISEENYKRFNGIKELSAYYKSEKDYVVRNNSLIEHVEFKKLNINFDSAPQNVKLILFRNVLIYYNPALQEKILQVLHRSLSVSGHLILGIREKIPGLSTSRDFEFMNEAESVYRKKF